MHAAKARPYLLSQQFPCSAGGRLLEAGHLDGLHQADAWESLRLAFGAGQAVVRKPCVCCGSPKAGHAHILAYLGTVPSPIYGAQQVPLGSRSGICNQTGGSTTRRLAISIAITTHGYRQITSCGILRRSNCGRVEKHAHKCLHRAVVVVDF